MESSEDIPSPIDLRDPEQARQWIQDTMARRPYRADFFHAFRQYVRNVTDGPCRALELGSGPGHLAGRLLELPSCIKEYWLLDFSDAMHAVARQSLAPYQGATRYVTADFRDAGALLELGSFDVVVTMQAVHELRHKRHAVGLYSRVLAVLRPGGHFLVCDHIVRDPLALNAALFMTREEQRRALETSGFVEIQRLLDLEGMTLHAARKAAALPGIRDAMLA